MRDVLRVTSILYIQSVCENTSPVHICFQLEVFLLQEAVLLELQV